MLFYSFIHFYIIFTLLFDIIEEFCRSLEDLHRLLQEGIAQSENKPQVRVIPEGRSAIHHAIKHGRKGELVVTLGDKVVDDIRYVQEYRDMVNEKKDEA